MGTLDVSDDTLDREAVKLAEAELEAQREELSALAKELDREALDVVKRAYRLFDDIKAHEDLFHKARRVADRNREELSFEGLRAPAAAITALGEHLLKPLVML